MTPPTTKYTSCSMQITKVVSGEEMQIAEISILDNDLSPVSIGSATSDCEPITAERASRALDGNVCRSAARTQTPSPEDSPCRF